MPTEIDDDSKLVAGGDATIRSCERAMVVAGGTLRAQEAVTSELCAHRVEVPGRVRGGKVVADGPKAGVLDALMKGRVRAAEG